MAADLIVHGFTQFNRANAHSLKEKWNHIHVKVMLQLSTNDVIVQSMLHQISTHMLDISTAELP